MISNDTDCWLLIVIVLHVALSGVFSSQMLSVICNQILSLFLFRCVRRSRRRSSTNGHHGAADHSTGEERERERERVRERDREREREILHLHIFMLQPPQLQQPLQIKPVSIAPLGGVIGVVDTPYGNYPQYGESFRNFLSRFGLF